MNSFILAILDRYRVEYFKHVYKDRLEIKPEMQFGRGSSIVFFPGAVTAKLYIGVLCIFRQRCTLSLSDNGLLFIGNNNFFNNDCSITCSGKIKIGDNNLFGENVKLYDHNHVFKEKNVPINDQGFKIGEITIGNNCWFGSNCVILNNVTIGDNVIVGANTLVYKSIPSNSLVKSGAGFIVSPRD